VQGFHYSIEVVDERSVASVVLPGKYVFDLHDTLQHYSYEIHEGDNVNDRFVPTKRMMRALGSDRHDGIK
jgi:hypothetical protein